MAIRRLNRRPRSVPDWRNRFDRPYHERWYAQPGEHFERPLPGQRSRDYRRLGSPASDPTLDYERRRRWGTWGQPGPFTGVGPQAYHLTDEQIHEQACERLMRHGQVDARQIQVEVNDGDIRLRGSVSGQAEKQMAEDALWSIPGVKDVKNMLRAEGERPKRARQSFRAHPPRGWKYKVEIFETKRAVRPASEQDWRRDRTELTMLEAGMVPVTGGEEALADSPAWTIFTQADEGSLDEREAGIEPSEKAAGMGTHRSTAPPEKAISLAAGMEVVDKEGLVLGRVKEIRPDDFLLDRPLARDLYVPFGVVQSADEHVVLNVRAEEIGDQGWDQPDIM